jgi:hypothetical protein
LVPDLVLSPARNRSDRVDVNNCLGGRRPNVPRRRPDIPSRRPASPVVARRHQLTPPQLQQHAGGVSTCASATGGEVITVSTAPRGGVTVHASSASASPTTCGSGDLVREGEEVTTGTPCGLATGLHGKTPRQDKNLIISAKTRSAPKILPRHDWKPSLNGRRHPRLRRCSTTLHLQSTSESIL